MPPKKDLPPINFAALADALLVRASTLVPAWLPGGKVVANNEYKVHSVWRAEKTASLSVCLSGERAGHWADFGGEHKGKDLVALYAAINGLDQGQAALQLARSEGLEDVAGVQRARGVHPSAPTRTPAPTAPPRVKEVEEWATVVPVPTHAPPATFWHYAPERTKDKIAHLATYQVGDALYGYVVRFTTSDGGKETLPYTWCQSMRDGTSKWHWKTWADPRPLYLPSHRLPEGRTVVLVEGEKKADVLHELLDAQAPNTYCVASWPGGSKAWKKADWTWLASSSVILWPDCDGKREPLTNAERAQYPDDAARLVVQAGKPLLLADKQVGMKAMQGIGALLRDTHSCMVQMLPIPEPGAVTDGWDCADAILVDGWDFDRVMAFFAQASMLPAGAPSAAAAFASSTSGDAPAGGGEGGGGGDKKIEGLADAGDGDDEFAAHLEFMCEALKCKTHELGVNRKLVITALRKAPELRECLGLNKLTGAPSARLPWPWREGAGPLEDSDALRLGDYLSTRYKLKAASRAALDEAIETVADERCFHPIRDWLQTLTHDGKPRINKWLIYVLRMDPETLTVRRQRYLELVGRFLLMGLVARVMEPGCKFDYSPVLEGPGGIGKSTFVKTLVGVEFFSDTHFDIGAGKDGFEQLEGLWGYELSELTALRKADSEQVKQFFSSTSDRFRGAYGKYVQKHDRQCVIFCSTNKRQYLYDLTGNRRFWPVWIDQRIRLDWLRKYREQLFAEAMALYLAGDRYAPSPEEEEAYFVPEQKARLVETAVQSRLYELLTREGAPAATESKSSAAINQLTTFVTLSQLVVVLGADAAKSTSILESQIRGWLEAMGWEHARETGGARRRGYRQPDVWPPKIDPEDEAGPPVGPDADRQTQADVSEGDDDLPL